MKTRIVPIGNSRGIRIPKSLLEHCAIADAVDLRVEGNRLILTPERSAPRQGWAAAAAEMHRRGDDRLMIPDVFDDDPEASW